MFRILINLLIVAALSLIVFMVFLPTESFVLENTIDIIPKLPIKQPMWIENFVTVGIYCMAIAVVFSLIWSIGGTLLYSITDWQKAGGWYFWLAVGLLMILTIVSSGYLLNYPTQDNGVILASSCYLVNGLFIFWISSLLKSPVTIRFAPLGSVVLRKVRLLRRVLN